MDEREPGDPGLGASGSSSGGAATTGGGGPSQAALDACETDCLRQVLSGPGLNCKLCHSANPQIQFSQLDLESPSLGRRLRDVDAVHGDLLPGAKSTCASTDKLINAANPEQSWLLKKLMGQQGGCGTPMPQGAPPLSAAELACFGAYVTCVAHAR